MAGSLRKNDFYEHNFTKKNQFGCKTIKKLPARSDSDQIAKNTFQ